jgi:hypothetical protein
VFPTILGMFAVCSNVLSPLLHLMQHILKHLVAQWLLYVLMISSYTPRISRTMLYM